MKTQWKIFVYALALFLAGGVTGGLLGIKYARHPDLVPSRTEIARVMRSHLASRVGLSDEQLKAIDPIIDETAAHLEAIHLDTTQSVARVFSDFHLRIAAPAHLTDTQKATLLQIEKEHAAKLPPAASKPIATP